MESGHSTSDIGDSKAPWSREHVAEGLARFDQRGADVSQRQLSRDAGIPRSTLQFWIKRREQLDLEPELTRFLESPTGIAFIKRLLAAAHLVFGLDAGCGVRKICRFLELTHLDRVVAASYGTQQAFAQDVIRQTIACGRDERERLGSQMSERTISVCEDETFHPETCLVAIEPVSGFILLEAYRQGRDAETWNRALHEALAGLPVKVVQCVSDEARGLKAHARDLGAHHSPDLFHVQQELVKAASCVLASAERRAEQAVAQANSAAEQTAAELDACRRQSADSDAIRTLATQVDARTQALETARAAAEEARRRRSGMAAARRGLRDDDHPFDLDTGAVRDAAEVDRRLGDRFETIERVANAAGLSTSAHQRIAKARRVLPALVATIAFFWRGVRARVEPLSLPVDVEQSLINDLLAGEYLRLASSKAPTASRRQQLRDTAERLLQRARDGPLNNVPAAEREQLERLAVGWAGLFQRSSSCVEGRNGRLSLWHHSLHRLTGDRLEALTVLANFFHRHRDGTTTAERFFGASGKDIFESLLWRLNSPARPAECRAAA